MKMSRQNPGGQDTSERRAKGSEKYQAQGKGKITNVGYSDGPPYKHQTRDSPSRIEGMVMAGHVRTCGHANTSMKGATVTGSGKGLK